MMLHRHFEASKAERDAGATRLSGLAPSGSTTPDEPSAPVEKTVAETAAKTAEKTVAKSGAKSAANSGSPRKPGRPKKTT